MKVRKQEAIDLMFVALGNCLPYLERQFEKTKPPSEDYFSLPHLIIFVREALDAGRDFSQAAGRRNKPGPKAAA